MNEKNIKAAAAATTTTQKKEEIFFSPPLKTVWWLCIAVNRITQHSFFSGGFFCDIRVCRRCGVRKYIFCQCIEKERIKNSRSFQKKYCEIYNVEHTFIY